MRKKKYAARVMAAVLAELWCCRAAAASHQVRQMQRGLQQKELKSQEEKLRIKERLGQVSRRKIQLKRQWKSRRKLPLW